MKNIFTGKNMLLLLVLGLYAVYNNYYLPSQQNQTQESPQQEQSAKPSNDAPVKIERKDNDKTKAVETSINNSRSKAPSYVYEVWDYVVAHGEAMPNYVGGRTFQNREKRLPKTDNAGKKLRYQEWDVHKKISGQNRGAERLVTGSNKSAYYTKDHYKSFVRLDE